MKKMLKWHFRIQSKVRIDMPAGAIILCVQNQNEQATLWAIADPEREPDYRDFEIYGDNDTIELLTTDFIYPMNSIVNRGKIYIGTFQMSSGARVYHVFEDRTDR